MWETCHRCKESLSQVVLPQETLTVREVGREAARGLFMRQIPARGTCECAERTPVCRALEGNQRQSPLWCVTLEDKQVAAGNCANLSNTDGC